MIIALLTDSNGSHTLPQLEIPLSTDTLENAVDVTTADFNVFTTFINNKREWTITWSALDEDEYDEIKAVYDQQQIDFKYPTLSISYYSISAVPVRMYLNRKDVVDNCGTVENVTIKLRETAQLA